MNEKLEKRIRNEADAFAKLENEALRMRTAWGQNTKIFHKTSFLEGVEFAIRRLKNKIDASPV